jgi:hypothetical protein
MSLTKAQANARLSKINTADELRKLISEIDTKGDGNTTLLWSGYAAPSGRTTSDGIHSSEVSSSLRKANTNLRTIAKTEAAKFLELERSSREFNQALSDKLKAIFNGDDTQINAFIYGPSTGNPRVRTAKGVWDDVSDSFVKQAKGDVRLIVGGAGLDKVFAQTEIHALLANPNIRSVEGVPIEGLRDLAKASGVGKVLQLLMGLSEANTGMIQLQVDSSGRPIQSADGTYRLDATDYMKMNTLNTRLPAGMRPVMEFIPEERRLRHSQAVEEIFKLHPILRGRNYALPMDVDPFKHQQAIARVSTFAGRIADVHSMTTMLAEAGVQLHRGDHRAAHNTVTSWVAENAGGLAAGRLATLLVAPLMATGPLGMIIGAGIIIGASVGGADLAKKLHKKLRDRLREIDEMASPLVLDLDGNGIQTLTLNPASLHFDLDANGYAEQTGWVGPNDGLLVLDLNGNGRVDNGRELFGNHTRLADGTFARNGFEALASHDGNRDRRIDRNDSIWARLRVWRDRNSDGVSDSSELLQLGSTGISALLLAYTNSSEVDASGNAHRQKGTYQRSNGQRAALTDVWFARDTLNSRQLQLLPVDRRTALLPDLQGMGIVPSLHQALVAPGNSKLREVLSQWLGATRLQRQMLREQLLDLWADGSSNPFSHEQREIVTEDPLFLRKLAVIEKLTGQIVPETEEIMGPNKAQAIEELFRDVARWVDMLLSTQVDVQPLLDLARPLETDRPGDMQINLTAAVEHLRSRFLREQDPGLIPMIQWQLAERGVGGLAFFESLRQQSQSNPDAFALAMRQHRPQTSLGEWIPGSPEDEALQGTPLDDLIEAGDGYNAIDSHEGNDILIGGTGSDRFYGGPGADTYYISPNRSDAYDQILDASSPQGGADRMIFTQVVSSSVRLYRHDTNVIIYSGRQQVATIEKQLLPQHRIEELHFADGVIWDHNTLQLQLPIRGTTGNDRLIGTSDTSNRLQGLAGQDTLIGGTLADHLEGGAGHDVLTGLAGHDILDGGEGNDTLEGGEGGDRYLFSANGGHDRLRDLDQRTSENDRVVLSDLGLASLSRVQRNGFDLTLHFGASTSLTLVNQLQPFSRIEEVQFANGPTWSHTTLLQQVS